MTIDGVTECSGGSIKAFIQSSDTGNFCIVLTKVSDGSYSGQFTMPSPACFTYPISYKCDANGDCSNSNTFNAQGPNGENSVHLRASTFSDGCTSHVADENCAAPSPSPTPSPSPQGCSISCPPDTQVECGASTDPAATGTPTVTGDCTATYTDSLAAACGNTGVITRTWKVADSNGVETTCDQKITIVDTTKPTIGAPGSNATIECPNTPQFTPPTANDSCGDAHVIEEPESRQEGSCPGSYSLTKTWHAEDDCGNKSDSVSQTIRVVDTTAPTITDAGASGTIECPSQPVFTPPTATDSCGSARVIEDSDVTLPGSCGNTYSRTKTWHAEDECGNSSGSKSQTITVVDTTPPSIGDAGPNATIYCPSQPVFTAPTASDSCGNATVIEVSDVTTPGSCGTYTRTKTWQARDECGNLSGQKSQTIIVECNNCGGLTMGFWQNKNGQEIIKSADQTSLQNFLIGFAPFQDLVPQVVAAYVTNVIKAANASGASMNSMLKAQMLATALDVYFSDPPWVGIRSMRPRRSVV